MCKPLFPSIKTNKDIFCSFMGRFDTHYCRINMFNILNTNRNIKCLIQLILRNTKKY